MAKLEWNKAKTCPLADGNALDKLHKNVEILAFVAFILLVFILHMLGN